MGVANADDSELDEDWREMINMENSSGAHRDELIYTLEPLQTTWYGSLGRFNISKHRIQLQTGTVLSCKHPSSSGQAQIALEKVEIDRLFKAGVIEPATSKWSYPIVFSLKKDGSLRFFIYYRRLYEATLKDS